MNIIFKTLFIIDSLKKISIFNYNVKYISTFLTFDLTYTFQIYSRRNVENLNFSFSESMLNNALIIIYPKICNITLFIKESWLIKYLKKLMKFQALISPSVVRWSMAKNIKHYRSFDLHKFLHKICYFYPQYSTLSLLIFIIFENIYYNNFFLIKALSIHLVINFSLAYFHKSFLIIL